jgi:hypothetical protein
MKKLILLNIFIWFLSLWLPAQTKARRRDKKNEVFVAAHITGEGTHIYGMGHEFTLFKKGKKDFFTLQNEIMTSIIPRFGTIDSRIQTLFKWNRQYGTIISFGAGSAYNLNAQSSKFSYIFNNSYKYCFKRKKITLSASLWVIVSRVEPHVGIITGPICVADCPKWNYRGYSSISVGKYF